MSWKAKRDRWATSDGLIRRAIPNLCRDSDSPRQHEDSECNEGEARRTFFSWNGSSSSLLWSAGTVDVAPMWSFGQLRGRLPRPWLKRGAKWG